jgi:hypothetical protein
MNYRGAFQSVNVVLTVVWTSAMAFIILSGFWQPWYSPIFNRGSPFSSYQGDAPKDKHNDSTKGWSYSRPRKSRTIKTVWLAGVLLIPPFAVYAVLFVMIPWIYRGFRGAHI